MTFALTTHNVEPRRTLEGLPGLLGSVGQHLGYGNWYSVTQEMVDGFAGATGDHQWIHVDPDRAKQGVFGGTIAHGFLTLSLVSVLLQEVVVVSGVAMAVNYGVNRVRFPTPVRVGSKVRIGPELLDVHEQSSWAQVTTRATVEVEATSKPACVAELVTRYYTTPPD